MFPQKRYMTARIDREIPPELQLFLWQAVDRLGDDADYLQVFQLTALNSLQQIVHTQEVPNMRRVYLFFPADKPIAAKIYIIAEDDYATMLFAEEY